MKSLSKDQVKQLALAAISENRELITGIGEQILRRPETGYREYKTGALVRETFEKFGLTDIKTCALTGVRGTLTGGSLSADTRSEDTLSGETEVPVCAAILGELDAVLSPSHPFADPATGAAHACGHNAQIAAMIGCAAGLLAVKDYLAGNVCFLAAPAEEYIELEYRLKLRSEGKITCLGGKQQLIMEGAFDDIDMAMMVHAETLPENSAAISSDCTPDTANFRAPIHIVPNPISSGFIGKNIRFTGKEAHAGGAPWDGINALNAAVLAMDAIHMQRETFRDEDNVRVHPIITKGGDLVNTVPADVRMESYVRASSISAMSAANEKVNRCIRGAAYAIGADVSIEDLPGYLPLEQNPVLSELFSQNAQALLPGSCVEHGLPFCGSTDAGDLSFLLPVLHSTVSGFTGAAHSCDYRITDPELAYLVPAKLLAMTVIDLLYGDAQTALELKRKYPRKSKEMYKRNSSNS